MMNPKIITAIVFCVFGFLLVVCALGSPAWYACQVKKPTTKDTWNQCDNNWFGGSVHSQAPTTKDIWNQDDNNWFGGSVHSQAKKHEEKTRRHCISCGVFHSCTIMECFAHSPYDVYSSLAAAFLLLALFTMLAAIQLLVASLVRNNMELPKSAKWVIAESTVFVIIAMTSYTGGKTSDEITYGWGFYIGWGIVPVWAIAGILAHCV